MPRVEEWLVAQRPDVLLIQETKQTDEKFPFEALAALGYESAHYGEGRWNGVAILSSIGLRDVVKGFDDDDPEARFIGATCGGLRVYSCYVPNGRALDHAHYQYKLRWLASLAAHLGCRDSAITSSSAVTLTLPRAISTSTTRVLFVGMTHVSEPEREAIRTLEAFGLVDLTRRLQPDVPSYSWWDYRNGAFHRGWGTAHRSALRRRGARRTRHGELRRSRRP